MRCILQSAHQSHRLPAHLELQTYFQCANDALDRKDMCCIRLCLPKDVYAPRTVGELIMWTDPIVAQIHQTRADITLKAGDNSHAITLAAQRMAQEAGQKFGVQWRKLPLAVPAPKPIGK